MKICRRIFVAGSAGAVLFPRATLPAEETLRQIADARGLVYGAAISSYQLRDDPAFMEVVAREANTAVAENEMKRVFLQPAKRTFDFTGPDALVRFARASDMRFRFHTLVWYAGNPDWLIAELGEAPSEDEHLVRYVDQMVRRFRTDVRSWDVVNECVNPDDGAPDGMRVSSPWYQAFGERHIDLAFQVAREADPTGKLYICDYGLELSGPWFERRRRAMLELLERLVIRNVPVDGLALQGHLQAFEGSPLVERELEDFLKAVSDLGLEILISEFDVADRSGPKDPAKRDAEIATLTRRFLDVVLDNPASVGLLTWGLSDRYSWLSWFEDWKWADGSKSRVLPLDDGLQRKPMWSAIADALRTRPVR